MARRRSVQAVVAVAALMISALGVALPDSARADATSTTETTGSVAHTWTDYGDAGGTEGTEIGSNQQVQITCRVQGFKVADGDVWWYEIASPPWNNQYYVSADAFYNNGQTSGSLKGSALYDPAVPECGSEAPPEAPPATQPPTPTPTISLSQGPLASVGYWYAISFSGFSPNSTLSVSCYDSVSFVRAFDISVNGSGAATTQSECRSNDGPDHWVVADGVTSNHVPWGSVPHEAPAPPVTTSNSAPTPAPASPQAASSPAPTGERNSDPCIAYYKDGGTSSTHSIFAGSETDYDRTASLYHVCEGFGAPEGLQLSWQMKCALIAAAATYDGPPVSVATSKVCDYAGAAADLFQGNWLGAVTGLGCSFFSDVFATGAGIFAAGATSETGPGAVAVGVETYQALAASLQVACGGLLDGGANALGQSLEANHETAVAMDIMHNGECLHYRRVFGYISWSAASC